MKFLKEFYNYRNWLFPANSTIFPICRDWLLLRAAQHAFDVIFTGFRRNSSITRSSEVKETMKQQRDAPRTPLMSRVRFLTRRNYIDNDFTLLLSCGCLFPSLAIGLRFDYQPALLPLNSPLGEERGTDSWAAESSASSPGVVLPTQEPGEYLDLRSLSFGQKLNLSTTHP